MDLASETFLKNSRVAYIPTYPAIRPRGSSRPQHSRQKPRITLLKPQSPVPERRIPPLMQGQVYTITTLIRQPRPRDPRWCGVVFVHLKILDNARMREYEGTMSLSLLSLGVWSLAIAFVRHPPPVGSAYAEVGGLSCPPSSNQLL